MSFYIYDEQRASECAGKTNDSYSVILSNYDRKGFPIIIAKYHASSVTHSSGRWAPSSKTEI
ncbi:hypothetical protein [Paenibacillus sp. N3.4]|uniref:hypothetical protein n=1 Tax=Paenibacillus sp. N3.4 TaxID=2603222 RepID=UPI0011CBCEE9|nr:hypothetical protein [Paenibacillus sp. N3.4]TXK71817.1 hypothetical protein FU659_32460 [Paenibacillus sp. N3.4]